MKLGTETGSLINHLHSRAVIGQPAPEIGMGATLLGWTDRHAATITCVVTQDGKLVRIGVKQDIATRIDRNGMSESQEYSYTENPDAYTQYFRLNKRGMWEGTRLNPDTKRWVKSEGCGLRIGERDEYYDFSF